MSSKPSLRQELVAAGAQPAETPRLLEIAGQLQQLKATSALPAAQASRQRWSLAPLVLTSLVGLLIGGAVVASAQTRLPGSWLYPVKRLSEKVAVTVDSNYRATAMMRRSQEVKDLIGRHADTNQVLATLADYRSAASAYKAENYAAFAYCKQNLQQAARQASPTERQAIARTLSSLQI